MMNLAQNVKITRVLNAVAAGQTAQNGAVIDMANFEGVVFLAAFGTLDAGAVTGLKAQQGLQPNLSDAADLAGAALAIADTADNKLLVLDVFRPAERYVRAVVTRGTADAVIDGVIAIQYGARVMPATQDATVAGIETHVSPAEGTA
jgi:crotonobetainyl-CoA:carnitine CoA-transferase CaiB-like acyl-CoA transferase